MKIGGIILTTVGALLVIVALAKQLPGLNIDSSHDLGKFVGGFSISIGIFAAGLWMLRKHRSAE